jgi:pSer/pThr/pTyr-binding forkhead associated (FHA) protein
MAQLLFLTGPLAGKRARLKGKRISIGRDPDNSIRIDDESVSPRHLMLHRDADGYSLKIDDSRPPVAVNGKQVVTVKLADGDKLQIGAVQAKYNVDPKPAYNPLDFWSTAPPPDEPEEEILSLDDAEQLSPLEASVNPRAANRPRRALIAFLVLLLMLGGSVFAFRKELWKERPRPVETVQSKEEEKPAEKKEPEEQKQEEPPPPMKEPELPPLAIGAGEAGQVAGGKVLRTKDFKSHQEAVEAAGAGDSVIFDSPDAKPIVVQKPIRDVQFISGSATWELHTDLIDCQFILHETKQIIQRAGRLQRCVFFRCLMKQTHLIYSDAVSFYFDERSPLHPKDNPDAGKTPILLLTGFVRDVLIMKPTSGSPTADKRFDMNWGPVIRIHASDPEGDGRGTYILSPVVLGQRAWTPHQIARANSVTYAHLTTDHGSWADPVFELLRGNDCVVLCTSLAGDAPTTSEQFAQPPRKLKYHDHEEFGHDGPAFRGAAMAIQGQRTRIVAHGDARKPWTVGRKTGLPGLHYADGIVAVDPFLKQFATERGGLSVNFAEPKFVFIIQPSRDSVEFLASQQQPDGSPKYPLDGPDLHKPTFVPLKDLRLGPGEFDNQQLADMTGKPMVEIEKTLATDKSIYLGPGTYEFKQTVRAGFVAGAGMEKTILKWPDAVDCAQRNCRGMINCTVAGGRFGYNSQAGLGGRVGNPIGHFLRTRFQGQREAGVNLHTTQFQTWQNCEFDGCRVGFTHGQDKSPGVYKGDKGATGGITIDNLNICNCSFRNIKHRAIDLAPHTPKLGHVGVHNCLFEDVGETAIRIDGGQTHLVQLCRLSHAGSQTYAPAIAIVSHGVLALSHLDVDCSRVKGNPLCVSLQGLAAVSHCTIKGMTTSLKSDGLLAGDYITADGNLQTAKGSLLCHCRFKNMNLPDGVALAGDKDFADVTAMSVATPLDKTPPPEVFGQKVRSVAKQRRLDWTAVDDPESGIAHYLIFADEKEIGRSQLRYEPPSDIHSPLLRIPPVLSFTDPNPANKGYNVVAVNGAGLASDGKVPPPRRLGAARAIFLTKQGEVIRIKDFINVKGKVTQTVDEEGNKHLLSVAGNGGLPNAVEIEWGEEVEVR